MSGKKGKKPKGKRSTDLEDLPSGKEKSSKVRGGIYIKPPIMAEPCTTGLMSTCAKTNTSCGIDTWCGAGECAPACSK